MKGFRPSSHRDAETSRRRNATNMSTRQFSRTSCTKAKLTDDQIRWVRANWHQSPNGTMTIAEMARQLKIRPSTVGQICRGDTWKEVK